MGRPLKIAQSQAVLTITATSASTQLVTVSNNLSTAGIIKGMPFVTASNVGNLITGTTYYVNQVVSNNTFSVSSTNLTVQPQTLPVLTTTTAQTVAATVAGVDTSFNNPNGSNTATNATTYGVVGGNTAQYVPTVLANVAIGKTGTGTLYSAGTGSNTVYGVGTDFANTSAQYTVYQVPVANVNGIQTDYATVGWASSTFGNVVVAVANTTATGNVIGTSGNALTLATNQPVLFSATFGGLTAGNVYFVATTPNAAAFTVSATQGGVPVQLTSNASVTANALQDRVVLSANNAANFTSTTGFVQATPEAGFIVRQKGKTKYLAQGSTTGLQAQCYTSNFANTALYPNTMTVLGTYANSSTVNLTNVNDYQSMVFYYTAAGSFTTGQIYIIKSVGTTDFTLIGAVSNTPGVQFTATGAGTGTGTAALANANPDIIATFGTAYAANTYPGNSSIPPYQTSRVSGQPIPIVTINNA